MLNLEPHAWMFVLCILLISYRGVSSFRDSTEMEYAPKDNRCALRLKRSQRSYGDDAHMERQPSTMYHANTEMDTYGIDPMKFYLKEMQLMDMSHEDMRIMEMGDEYTNPAAKYRGAIDSSKMEECVTNKDVNEALREAKKSLRFVPVAVNSFEVSTNDIDTVGNLITETTRILAEKFKLSFEEINEGLPSIDTSKTDIWDICPAKFKPFRCSVSRFRTIDGQCSSLKHSVMGSAGSPMKRILPPAYQNGIDSPRASPIDGRALPHVRKISTAVHTDITDLSDRVSILLMSWGQFIDHDLTLDGFVSDENGKFFSCCPKETHPSCLPIRLSKKDPFYSRFNSTCMEFRRSVAGLRPGCGLGPRVTANFVSTRMDANFLYGNTKSEARKLRLGTKGLMKSWPKFRDLGLKDLLPPLIENPDSLCNARPSNKFCFLAGDPRSNVQPHVIAFHTLYMRAHNRIAEELGFLNPHWDDERIYQETRHILSAVVQHIAFNEYIPILIGPDYMDLFNLTLKTEGYWNGYDKNAPLETLVAFQTAAFRFGHSLVHNKFRLYNKYHKFLDSLETRDILRMPYYLYNPGIMDKIIAGFLNSPIQSFDTYMVSDLTKHLFQPQNVSFGLDLASLNLMRGREHALPGYNDYREWCGLPRVKTFEELSYYLKNGTAFMYSKVYKHPDEMDLWTAGLAERAVKGGVIGPTFACIIAYQFNLIRKGDRFWYENSGFPSSFTPAQLRTLRKVTQAKIICDNADDIPTTQMWVLLMPHPVHNPRFNCNDLPQINLKYWIEDPKTESFTYTK